MSGTGLSAREEFRGRKLSYLQDLTLCFGDYCQAYRAPTFKNSMDPRTVGSIALCPMDNLTRSWIFMNLITVRTFTARKWKILPTPDIVIERIRQVATRRHATEGRRGTPTADRPARFEGPSEGKPTPSGGRGTGQRQAA
jgi:hypothetical protein